MIKEPISATASFLLASVQSLPLTASTLVAHIRFSTSGRVASKNTHPFVREVGGKDVVFAHNGTLSEHLLATLSSTRYQTIGETDSECAFLNLLEHSFTRGEVNLERLCTAIAEINQRGEFNFLMAVGDTLYAYHCRTG